MISVNDFRTGLTIEVDGGIWRVVDFQHVKPGKARCLFVRNCVTCVLVLFKKKHSVQAKK